MKMKMKMRNENEVNAVLRAGSSPPTGETKGGVVANGCPIQGGIPIDSRSFLLPLQVHGGGAVSCLFLEKEHNVFHQDSLLFLCIIKILKVVPCSNQ